MNTDDKIKIVKDFVKQYSGIQLFSTHEKVIDFHAPLYNVSGSSDDPKIGGKSWKRLLKSNGIDAPCYVTNKSKRIGKSHPDGWLGGHMIDNKDGKVGVGGECYLMPLCSWHNSTSRNGVAFTHEKTRMLKLYGYMQGEPAFTYLLRHPEMEGFNIAYFTGEDWTAKSISDVGKRAELAEVQSNLKTMIDTPFVLFEKMKNGVQIQDTNLK